MFTFALVEYAIIFNQIIQIKNITRILRVHPIFVS